MKELNKNKKVAIITVVVLVVIAIVVAVVFATQKRGNESGEASSDAPSPVYETVIDEQGNAVTKTDENGKPITKVDKNGKPVYEKTTGGKNSTASNNTTKKNQSNKKPGGTKTEGETEQTSEYTTNSPLDANIGPEIPLDEYALTESLALHDLQSYYNNFYEDKYIVNYDKPNDKDADNICLAVFEKSDKVKTKIEYRVMVNLLKGTYTQIDKDGKSKDITKAVYTPKK